MKKKRISLRLRHNVAAKCNTWDQLFQAKCKQYCQYQQEINPQFSENEDRLLMKLVLMYGPKFKDFMDSFPNKTYYSIKNRYYKHLRQHQNKILGIKENDVEKSPPSPAALDMNKYLNELPFSPEIKERLDECLNAFNVIISQTLTSLQS